mgnify:CR=1 FL=1|tara:strand:+ start:962 stop:1294 length:333 start_codon:yes stop_codon:yes gene_type:complete
MPNKEEIQYEQNRNDKDWQRAVEEHTKLGYSMFRIHKADGSIREVFCTLQPTLIPKTKSTPTEKSSKGNLVVYDVENKGWRTIKFSRVIFWKMLKDYPEPTKNSSFKEKE